MTINVGWVDRTIRVLLGAALLAWALGYVWPGTGWNWIGWVGIVPILTGFIGSCPVYSMLGVSTSGTSASMR